MATHDLSELSIQVYRLHKEKRLPVSKIAKRLRLDDDEVRGLIVDRWREDKESGVEDDHLRG